MDAEIIKRITRLEQEVERLKSWEMGFYPAAGRIQNGITFPLAATTTDAWHIGRPDEAANLYVAKVVLTCIVQTTFDATNTWQVTLNVQNNTGGGSVVSGPATLFQAGRAIANRFTHVITVNTLYTPTTFQMFYLDFTKVNAPGTLNVDTVTAWYAFA